VRCELNPSGPKSRQRSCACWSRAAAAELTLSEWVRDVLPGSSVEMGTMSAERTILAEVLAMRTILLNFMLKVGEGVTIPEEASRKLIPWNTVTAFSQPTV